MPGTINLSKNPWLESLQAPVGERRPTMNSILLLNRLSIKLPSKFVSLLID